MSNENFTKINEREEFYNSQSSDEKMDTGSESFLSTQNTPNSIQSSEFDELNDFKQDKVLRLQQPESKNIQNVLRLSKPLLESNNSVEKDDSLVLNMAKLRLDTNSFDDNNKTRPSNLGISPPKYCSTLTSTTNHPLMGLNSPEGTEIFPDIIPEIRLKKYKTDEENKDISLSSMEDSNLQESSLDFFKDGPQRNTSKNNLYISENSYLDCLSNSNLSPPDVARVSHEVSRRKIAPLLDDEVKGICSISKYVEERNRLGDKCISTPKVYFCEEEGIDILDIPVAEDFGVRVAEWCDSPSKLRSLPNFQLPIEMSSSIGKTHDLESPDVTSTSTQEDHSSYQALLDTYSGSVALKHNPKLHASYADTTPRRKIVALVQDPEHYSSDSEQECSLQSDEQVPEPLDAVSNNDSPQHSQSDSISIPEYSAIEERDDVRSWIKVPLPGGGYRSCDMKVIEPYKRVVSHGGYEPTGAAIIVFSACHLPHSDRRDYNYVMDNLFLYVLKTLEMLVTDDYILVYLHGSAAKSKIPTFHWLHECYKLIDRRLRKSLKHLYLVHPTFWIKTIVILCKPFVSSKFFRKISYVKNIKDLMDKIPVEPNAIPDIVREYDAVKR